MKKNSIIIFIYLILFPFTINFLYGQNITSDELLKFFWLPNKNTIENYMEENILNLESKAVILWKKNYEYIAAYFWIVHDKGERWMPMVIEAGFEDWVEISEVDMTINNEVFHFNGKKGNFRWKKEGLHSLDFNNTVCVINVFCDLDPLLLKKIINADQVIIALSTADSVIELVLYKQAQWQELLPHIQKLK